MTRLGIVGADGQLGFDLARVLGERGHEVVGWTHADIEVRDRASVERALASSEPDVVVNTAAINVEASESDSDLAYAINAVAPGIIAGAAAARGVRLLHISTDYVFDGTKGSAYIETDATAPINIYGASKLAGEELVLADAPDSLVIRTSGLYGARGVKAKNGMNFVTTMLKLATDRDQLSVVGDERLSPTNTLDLARQIATIIDHPELSGIVHAVAGGGCSWFEFASEIFRVADVEIDLQETTSAEFSANAKVRILRPADTTLANARLAEAGLDQMTPWQQQLAEYLELIGAAAN